MSESDPFNPEIHRPNPWEGVSVPPDLKTQSKPAPEALPQPEADSVAEQCELAGGFDKQKLQALELPPGLEHVRETLLRLPETLEFKPGVNLIFGPNGSGKSTLANALYSAIKARESYHYALSSGRSEAEANERALEEFELPRHRGTSYDEYLESWPAPLFGSALNLATYENNVVPIHFDGQKIDGTRKRQLREATRQQGFRHTGPFMELDGFHYSDDDLMDDAQQGRSSRQEVDRWFADYCDASFGSLLSRKRGNYDTPQPAGVEWDIPQEFQHIAGLGSGILSLSKLRKPDFYPGIAIMDEPETGMDIERHLALPEKINGWFPPGSIAVIATNSTELFRSDLPRIDLREPEKGVFTPETT